MGPISVYPLFLLWVICSLLFTSLLTLESLLIIIICGSQFIFSFSKEYLALF